MSHSWNFGFQEMIESVKEKYGKAVKQPLMNCQKADKEFADCYAITSGNIRSFIEEEAAESLKKKVVLNMEADLSSAFNRNMEIHSEAYKSLQERYDLLIDEVASEMEKSHALRKQLADADRIISNSNDVFRRLSLEGIKMTKEKDVFRKEALKSKEESLKSSAKLSLATEEIRSIKKAHQLFSEAKERDVSELCKKMDRCQEQIAALNMICEKLHESIPQDSSAIILTAMTKNEFDFKTAEPLVRAAGNLGCVVGFDQADICDLFCDFIVTTAETEAKILSIKKNIKLMASESNAKILIGPNGVSAKFDELGLVCSDDDEPEQVAKVSKKPKVQERFNADSDY